VSVWVQALLSLQVVPFVLFGFEHMPVPVLQTPTSWHWSSAVHTTGFEPVQVPDWQVSVWVQALLSLQVVPFVLFGFEHMPVPVLQTPTSWHWSSAVHTTEFEPTQNPDTQVSVWVQALLSLQVVPSVLAGFEHTPVPVLQVPTLWHWSSAVHTTGFEPVQVPDWQVSVWVQALPSLQVVPLVLAGFEHTPVPVLQVPTSWHWSSAVHTTGFDPVQTPDMQVSVWVQALLSLQVVPSSLIGFEHTPVLGWHTPTSWHWSSAVQMTGFDPVQTPDWQVSVWVQALPSLQVVPSALFGNVQRPVPLLHVPLWWHWSGATHWVVLPVEHCVQEPNKGALVWQAGVELKGQG
jgi:hypothetical protein